MDYCGVLFMAKFNNPIHFSVHFGVPSELLENAGVLDPSLNVDTKLFIDPLLLERSVHTEISTDALATFQNYFHTVIRLLAASTQEGDVGWRSACKLLWFAEVKGTCLGFGAGSISGSGSGPEMRNRLTKTAKQILDLGINDPDLFVAMALFEDKFGPDHISDMTTNIVCEHLLAFNARVLATLPVPCHPTSIILKNGRRYTASLPRNPFVVGGSPIILVPNDILRALPFAADWADVGRVAAENEMYRQNLNDHVARIWETKTRESKGNLRRWALSSKEDFETLLAILNGASPRPYDMLGDPLGEIFWRKLAETIADREPLKVARPKNMGEEEIASIVEQIIAQFKFLIESRRFSEELYYFGKPRPEKAAQRLFFAIAYAYCKTNDLDLTPEAETGSGPVDFKVSSGFSRRSLVEIKLSTNKKVVAGYQRQLEAYKAGEETMKGYYVVINVGQMGARRKNLIALKATAEDRGEQTSPIIFIDGLLRLSASKL